MDMPPTRYRVVEEGRRLVVVDGWTGKPVQYSAGTPQPPLNLDGKRHRTIEQAREGLRPGRQRSADMAPSSPGTGFGGPDWILSTQSWFDNRGPRRIRVAPGGQGQLTLLLGIAVVMLVFAIFFLGWLLLPVAVFLLLQPGTRKKLRGGVTAWLTGLGEPAD